MDQVSLETALLDAHARQDTAALVNLYTIAGNAAEQRQDEDAAGFYLTHAFIFALETGAPSAPELNARLAAKGRAHLIAF